MRIPPELTTLIIGVGSVLATFLVAAMTRRGAREDARIKEDDQAFEQMRKLAEDRLTEIVRLTTEREGAERLRDAANVEKERLRDSWEQRWDRQMARCRSITEPLVRALDHLNAADPGARQEALSALRDLADHNERDHTIDVDDDSVDRPA